MYSGLSAPQTDEEVAQLSARIMTGVEVRVLGSYAPLRSLIVFGRTQGGLFHAKRGCLIGVKCTDTHIVPVVVHHGCDVEPSNLDLHVERWVETEPGPRSGLQQLDSLGNCIRRYPYNAARAQPLHWTIYGPQTGVSWFPWSWCIVSDQILRLSANSPSHETSGSTSSVL